jgi:NADPH:quinone reductase-like Zn-dependent oxidoreductase
LQDASVRFKLPIIYKRESFALYFKMVQSSSHEETVKVTMRAAQGKDYGDIDEMLSVVDHVFIPHLEDKPKKDRKNWIVIKTLAVAVAPGDVRVLSGKTRELQGPPSLPYIVGGDVCGIVVEADDTTTTEQQSSKINNHDFRQDDLVVAMFNIEELGPRGAMAEYALVNTKVCDKVPDGVSPEEAAAVASSGLAAMAVAQCIQKGDRILIFGAGGGVGSYLTQLAKRHGASFVAGISRHPQRILEPPLSCDEAVDYTQENPWEKEEWINDPFDLVIDLIGGCWIELIHHSKSSGKGGMIVKTAKKGGRFVTMVADDPWFEAHSFWKATILFALLPAWRAIYTRVTRPISQLPTYSMVFLQGKREKLTEALSLLKDGTIVSCLDPSSPVAFTTEAVQSAFRLQESRHAQGKIVVRVAQK